jgi:hypothetical protein
VWSTHMSRTIPSSSAGWPEAAIRSRTSSTRPCPQHISAQLSFNSHRRPGSAACGPGGQRVNLNSAWPASRRESLALDSEVSAAGLDPDRLSDGLSAAQAPPMQPQYRPTRAPRGATLQPGGMKTHGRLAEMRWSRSTSSGPRAPRRSQSAPTLLGCRLSGPPGGPPLRGEGPGGWTGHPHIYRWPLNRARRRPMTAQVMSPCHLGGTAAGLGLNEPSASDHLPCARPSRGGPATMRSKVVPVGKISLRLSAS